MADNSPLPAAEYQYRKNQDGTVDSICLHCFLTVGTANRIEDLAGLEAAHNCYSKKRPKREHPPTDA